MMLSRSGRDRFTTSSRRLALALVMVAGVFLFLVVLAVVALAQSTGSSSGGTNEGLLGTAAGIGGILVGSWGKAIVDSYGASKAETRKEQREARHRLSAFRSERLQNTINQAERFINAIFALDSHVMEIPKDDQWLKELSKKTAEISHAAGRLRLEAAIVGPEAVRVVDGMSKPLEGFLAALSPEAIASADDSQREPMMALTGRVTELFDLLGNKLIAEEGSALAAA